MPRNDMAVQPLPNCEILPEVNELKRAVLPRFSDLAAVMCAEANRTSLAIDKVMSLEGSAYFKSFRQLCRRGSCQRVSNESYSH